MRRIFVTIGESIHNKKLVGANSIRARILDENLISLTRLLTKMRKKSLLMMSKKILIELKRSINEILSKSAFLSETFHP